jgi:hypothetical protein
MMLDRVRAPASTTDFDQVWYAANALRSGLDPYDAIGPTASYFRYDWPLHYPMPAIIVVLPLSLLPLRVAQCAFVALSSAALAYAVTRSSWMPLWIFASGAYIEAARLGQWSILFAAGIAMPAIAILFPAKPTLGLMTAPMVRFSLWTVAGWTALVVASFIALPNWVPSWLAAIRDAPHVRPLVAAPGGFLLLLAILRWRRREAWLLMAYALVPHTRVVYEAVPVLATVPRVRAEYMALAVGSMVAYAAQVILIPPAPLRSPSVWIAVASLFGVYLPALLMVMRRPNVAT